MSDIPTYLTIDEAVAMCVAELGWTEEYARYAVLLGILSGELPCEWIDPNQTKH